jgi:hypothetical protein
MAGESIGIVVTADSGPGVLHKLTGVIALRQGDITTLEIVDNRPPESRVYFEIDVPSGAADLLDEIRAMPVVRKVESVRTFQKIYGKRVIIMGGGAQVGQVAVGAISEADRHNIRGERISVDTIPLVGEDALADAVRAVGRLPRAYIALTRDGQRYDNDYAFVIHFRDGKIARYEEYCDTDLIARTFSTLSEVESNSSAVSSLLVSAITLASLAFTWISVGVKAWFLRVKGIAPLSANAGVAKIAAATVKDRYFKAFIPTCLQASIQLARCNRNSFASTGPRAIGRTN